MRSIRELGCTVTCKSKNVLKWRYRTAEGNSGKDIRPNRAERRHEVCVLMEKPCERYVSSCRGVAATQLAHRFRLLVPNTETEAVTGFCVCWYVTIFMLTSLKLCRPTRLQACISDASLSISRGLRYCHVTSSFCSRYDVITRYPVSYSPYVYLQFLNSIPAHMYVYRLKV